MPNDMPRAIQRLDYRPPAYLIDTVDLTFDLQDGETRGHVPS